jgi:hypothetical protein
MNSKNLKFQTSTIMSLICRVFTKNLCRFNAISLNDKSEKNMGKNKNVIWHPFIIMLIAYIFSFYPAAILYSINNKRMSIVNSQVMGIVISTSFFIILLILLYLFPNNKILIKTIDIVDLAMIVFIYSTQMKVYKASIQSNSIRSIGFFIFIYSCLFSISIGLVLNLLNTPYENISKGFRLFKFLFEAYTQYALK